MPIRAFLWDVDDTLFDYTGADTAGLARHLAENGLAERYGSPAAALALWRAATERHWARFAAGETTFRAQRQDRVRDFLGAPEMSDAEADGWFDRYVVHYQAAWALFPDVLPVLDALARDYRHGVLSNSSTANQDPKLQPSSGCASASKCWSAPRSSVSASRTPPPSSAPARRSGSRRRRWRTSATNRRSTPAEPGTPVSWPCGSTGTARQDRRPKECTGSPVLPSSPHSWPPIPVLEHGQPSGNVLSAPPERAGRPDGGANRMKVPPGLAFWWAIV